GADKTREHHSTVDLGASQTRVQPPSRLVNKASTAWSDFKETAPQESDQVVALYQSLLTLQSLTAFTREDPRYASPGALPDDLQEALVDVRVKRMEIEYSYPNDTHLLEDYACGAVAWSQTGWAEKTAIADRTREQFIRTVREVLSVIDTDSP
ncbi:hypothetical protein ACFY83_32490, partial [Streptomyces althioticus]|uniref:hypothetical protein n=1 Tax=Streptomyces althioticus TaxID=83380 RepID=UPI0036E929BD